MSLRILRYATQTTVTLNRASLIRLSTLCASGGDNSTGRQLEAMRAALMAIMETCGRIHGDLAAGQQASDNSLADIQVKQASANGLTDV